MNTYQPIRTREDIVEKAIVQFSDAPPDSPAWKHQENGRCKRYVIVCGPSASDMDTFGKVKDPSWTEARRAVEDDNSMLGGYAWSGCATWQQAIDMARYGWPEGSRRAKEIMARLAVKLPHAVKHKMRTQGSVAPVGTFTLNIPAVVQGQPDQFVGKFKTREKTRGRKIIRVAVNIISSGCVGPEQVMNRGACIMALMNTLQRLGFGMDLTVFDTSSTRGMVVMQTWHVAPAGRHVNTDVVAYALVNPSAGRRLLFAMLENSPEAYRYSGGYGGMFPMKKYFPDYAKQFDIILDSGLVSDGPEHWVDDASMLAWIKSQLHEQGINISDTDFAE